MVIKDKFLFSREFVKTVKYREFQSVIRMELELIRKFMIISKGSW